MTRTLSFDNFCWINNFELHFVKHSQVLKACFEARSVVYNHSNPENLAIQPRKPSSAGYYVYSYIFNMYVLPKTRKKIIGSFRF